MHQWSAAFIRVGIESYSAKRWLLERTIFDGLCNPDANCGGRNAVRWTNRAYGGFRGCQVISAFVGDWNSFTVCTYILNAMDYSDATWDRITAPNDHSDGVVQGVSQVYPRALFNYVIPGGDSHTGEPKSDQVKTRIESAFDNYFGVHRF